MATIVEDELDLQWSCYGFLPDWLKEVPGVKREWERFNRAVIEAYLRHSGSMEFEIVSRDGVEHDPIDFGEGEDDDDGD